MTDKEKKKSWEMYLQKKIAEAEERYFFTRQLKKQFIK